MFPVAVDQSSSGRVMKSQGEGVIYGEKHVPDKSNTPWIAKWTGPCSGVHTTEADAWLQALDESIIGREGGGIAHRGRSLISTIALLSLRNNHDFLFRLLRTTKWLYLGNKARLSRDYYTKRETYHMPWSLVSPDHRKGPKWLPKLPSATAYPMASSSSERSRQQTSDGRTKSLWRKNYKRNYSYRGSYSRKTLPRTGKMIALYTLFRAYNKCVDNYNSLTISPYSVGRAGDSNKAVVTCSVSNS